MYVEGNGPSNILWLSFLFVEKITFQENGRCRPIRNWWMRYGQSNTCPPPFRMCPSLWQWKENEMISWFDWYKFQYTHFYWESKLVCSGSVPSWRRAHKASRTECSVSKESAHPSNTWINTGDYWRTGDSWCCPYIWTVTSWYNCSTSRRRGDSSAQQWRRSSHSYCP